MMIDLLNYFDSNSLGTYYERFSTNIQRDKTDFWGNIIGNAEYILFDLDDIKDKFREICQPSNSAIENEDSWFYLICFYFFKEKIYIEQFPNLFERPKDLKSFSVDQIRKYAFDHDLTDGNKSVVRWQTRREIIESFKFIKREASITINDDMADLLKQIDTNALEWQEMTLDTKLRNLNNAIEYLLKVEEKFIDIPNITNIETLVNCQSFRTMTHLMRHGTTDVERNFYSESEKLFLVDYGISLVHLIQRNLRCVLG